MHLNPDSVRAVLLYLEDNLKYPERMYSNIVVSGIINKYQDKFGKEEDLIYAIKQLRDNKMIVADPITKDMHYNKYFFVSDITPKGHEFLNNIKNETIWSETKKIAKQFGSFALSILNQIAADIISSKLTGL